MAANWHRTILSLCDLTGNWPAPYRAAGYDVRQVDLDLERPAWVRCDCCENYLCRIHGTHAHDCPCPPVEEWANSPYDHGSPGQDVRTLDYPGRVHGILAAPPCTAFAGSGAQYWPDKDADGRTLEGLSVVDACLRLVAVCRPVWWVLENPVGRLSRWLGPPAAIFQPWMFGDPYTKRTCLWGNFVMPAPLFTTQRAVDPVRVCPQGSWLQRVRRLRNVCPGAVTTHKPT
jgi:hypothetical protein